MNKPRVLGIIPARGGSKGLPRKNVLPLLGRPLIDWTIKAGLDSEWIDKLILSSDDPEIIEVAKSCGCEVPFVRPAELAGDSTPTMDVVIHALDQLDEYDVVVLLQPTSPLRKTHDIDSAFNLKSDLGAPACISITPVKHHPAWTFSLTQDGWLLPNESANSVTRRQELSDLYAVNGAIYIANCDWLRRKKTFFSEQTVGYKMPTAFSVDIDDPLDFEVAEAILEKMDQV